MKQYLLSVYHPENQELEPARMDKIGADVNALNDEIRAAGRWVFGGGLLPSSSATVLRLQDGQVVMTDGPFAEGKEHVGGFWVIKAPDLDQALEWGRRATQACTVPIQVRPSMMRPRTDLSDDGLDAYHLFHAIRADLLRRLGRKEEAALAYEAAIARTGNATERAFLQRRRQEIA